MIKTELLLDGPDGLKITHLSKNSYKHKTGNQIMLMPFNTRFKEACTPDLQSFKGIVGECFRISNKRAFDKDFSTDKGSSFKKKIRDYVLKKLHQKGIEATFHFQPLHSSPMGKKLGYQKEDFKLTEEIAGSLLRLPIYPDLSQRDLEYIIAALRDIFSQLKQVGV
jgi:hypothetical protein